jgi:transposase InsO family protein
MIPPSWPFAVWGVDILRPFPRAVGEYRFLFVAIDKFTKWLEATSVVSITQGVVVAFLKSIVYRFGVPSRIFTDNGTQFRSRLFQEYCEGISTQLCFASVAHPKSNSQVERANTEILRGLKTRTYDCLKKHGANWVSELPYVLWGNRTTPSRATGETTFFLVYGAEACLPLESLWAPHRSIRLMSLRRNNYGMRTWTSSTSTDGERRSEMHGTTRRSGATTNGSCIVGSSGSGTWS